MKSLRPREQERHLLADHEAFLRHRRGLCCGSAAAIAIVHPPLAPLVVVPVQPRSAAPVIGRHEM